MPDVPTAESRFGDAADREHAAALCELTCKRHASLDLVAGRPSIRTLRSRMGRDDVPEQNVVLDIEVRENAVDDRRGRLARAGSRQLAFGCERDPGNACASVTGSFADEQQRGVVTFFEVVREALGEPRVAVLVERVADLRNGEALYQRSQRMTSSIVRLRCDMRLDAWLALGSGSGLPMVTPATTETSSGMPSSSLNAGISGTVTP
jgi:hypothetical protein